MKQIIYNTNKKEAYIMENSVCHMHRITKEMLGYYLENYKFQKTYGGDDYIWFKLTPIKIK